MTTSPDWNEEFEDLTPDEMKDIDHSVPRRIRWPAISAFGELGLPVLIIGSAALLAAALGVVSVQPCTSCRVRSFFVEGLPDALSVIVQFEWVIILIGAAMIAYDLWWGWSER